MKKLALVVLGVWLVSGVAWAIDELDATKPASTSTVRDLGIYEKETRAKVNEIIDAIDQAARNWSRKATAYTATTGERIACDTRSAAVTITLPADSGEGESIEVIDAFSTWDTYGCTLDGNGVNINGGATYTSYIPDDFLIVIYMGASAGWRAVSFGSSVLRGY